MLLLVLCVDQTPEGPSCRRILVTSIGWRPVFCCKSRKTSSFTLFPSLCFTGFWPSSVPSATLAKLKSARTSPYEPVRQRNTFERVTLAISSSYLLFWKCGRINACSQLNRRLFTYLRRGYSIFVGSSPNRCQHLSFRVGVQSQPVRCSPRTQMSR